MCQVLQEDLNAVRVMRDTRSKISKSFGSQNVISQ